MMTATGSNRILERPLLLVALFFVIALSAMATADTPDGEASRILDTAGVRGGLIVHLGCGDGKLTAAFRFNDSCVVHGLDVDADNIRKARRNIQSQGLYGPVSVETWTGDRLPYVDNLVKLIVAERLGGVPRDEMMRVLAPGGVLCTKTGGTWEKSVKGWPETMDDWTHYLHDASGNAVAADTQVAPPGRVQWVCGPRYCRSHEIDTSVCAVVSTQGRIFYILDEGLIGITDEQLPSQWALVCRDAFSGVLLWKRPLPNWGWRQWKKEELAGKDWTSLRGQRTSSPAELPRRLVVQGDKIYVTLGFRAPVSILDAATGDTLTEIDGTGDAQELVSAEDVLVVRVKNHEDSEARSRRGQAGPESILAIDAASGEKLWELQTDSLMRLSLAVEKNRVFYNNRKEIVCRDLDTGDELWRADCKSRLGRKWHEMCTMVAHEDVVLFLAPDELVCFSAKNGERLWTSQGGKGPGVANPPDLFVADGLVWAANSCTGRDILTGESRRTLELGHLITPGHHFRCYRSKATERYLLRPKRGVEFIDIANGDHMRHDWLRAPCKHGFVPCNGLLYMPPHQCFCYPGAKMAGFLALGPRKGAKPDLDGSGSRLDKGPAYGTLLVTDADYEDEWPTFRHDFERSGHNPVAVPPELERLWQSDLGDELTQPVVADGKLFVALKDSNSLACIDAADGGMFWRFTAGGRIDSPPTVFDGLVLFGAADGYVYCARASDGEFVWRFRAAPGERRICSFDRLESAWPVHGSVLVKDGLAYFAAGRSSFLDGGIYVYALEPDTGEVAYQTCLEGPWPDLDTDVGRPFDMEGTKSDVLVSDGEYLYMQQAMLDSELNQREAPRLTQMGDRKMGRHIFSTAGFLDDSWWNRTFWMYSERWPGFYIANQAPKAGQLLVFDDDTTFGVKCYTRRNRHSPMFFPETTGYLLFADDNDNEPVLVDEKGKPEPIQWLPPVNPDIGHGLGGQALNRDKGTGFTRAKPAKWTAWLPIRMRAMVLAGDTLFVAGPPDVLEPNDPLAAFEGRAGGTLRAVSPANGEKLSEMELDSPPVFDGMIAAGGKVYISLCDGRVVCFGQS